MDSGQQGQLAGTGPSHLTIYGSVAIAQTWDWPDHALNTQWLLRGKKQIWFDYLALLERGLTGAELEGKLNRLYVTVYGKMYSIRDGGLFAYVLVDKNRVTVTQKMQESQPDVVDSIKSVLIDMGESKPGRTILKDLYNIDSLQEALSTDYDPVREAFQLVRQR